MTNLRRPLLASPPGGSGRCGFRWKPVRKTG